MKKIITFEEFKKYCNGKCVGSCLHHPNFSKNKKEIFGCSEENCPVFNDLPTAFEKLNDINEIKVSIYEKFFNCISPIMVNNRIQRKVYNEGKDNMHIDYSVVWKANINGIITEDEDLIKAMQKVLAETEKQNGTANNYQL